jgi:hypothetical protein
VKRISLFGCFVLLGLFGVPASLSAQSIDATVCDILANPQSFDGKIVRVKGTVAAGFEEFSIKGSDCHLKVNAIWLSYPKGTGGKAGPAASVRLQLAKNSSAQIPTVNRSAVSLDKNKDFKEFDTLLSTPAKTSAVCLGCVKFTVMATLVGRIDAAKATGIIRDSSGAVSGVDGFGNLNRYTARLVLQSVSDVTSQEIDYSKSDIAAMNQSFRPEAPNPSQVQRASDAFGKPGEKNGVELGFGVENEVAADDGGKYEGESPDGIVFNVRVDGDRLKKSALTLAIAHLGTHIADLRSTTPEPANSSFFSAEFHGWQTTVMNSMGLKVTTLALPGGYTIYNSTWATPDMTKDSYGEAEAFLSNWVGLTP